MSDPDWPYPLFLPLVGTSAVLQNLTNGPTKLNRLQMQGYGSTICSFSLLVLSLSLCHCHMSFYPSFFLLYDTDSFLLQGILFLLLCILNHIWFGLNLIMLHAILAHTYNTYTYHVSLAQEFLNNTSRTY